MSTMTPAFNPTMNQKEDEVKRPFNENGDTFITDEHIDTKMKLKNFQVQEANFDETLIRKKLNKMVNRELPQPFPLKSQIPETFTSEYIMKPIDITKVKR